MQLSAGTAKVAAKRIGIQKLKVYDIHQNIEIGVSYLMDLFRERSNMLEALTIYNRGYKKFKEGNFRVSSYARSVYKRGKYLNKILSNKKEYCSK